MSRVFTSMCVVLSIVCPARRRLVDRCAGTKPTRVAARTSGAASSISSAAAPTHFRDFIRWALLSLGPMSEGQLGAEAHHARDAVQERTPLGQLIALDRPLRTVFDGIRVDERLTVRRIEPVGAEGRSRRGVDRVDVVSIEEVE